MIFEQIVTRDIRLLAIVAEDYGDDHGLRVGWGLHDDLRLLDNRGLRWLNWLLW